MAAKLKKYGNATIPEWEAWIKEELKPPVKVTGEVEYVVRAFDALIKDFKKLESKIKESKK
jgi:hypothetical protein